MSDLFKIGETIIDPQGLSVTHGDTTYSVEPKVMKLFETFIDNPNIVLTREKLIEAVWGVDFGGDERLSRAVSLLRKALNDKRSNGKYKYIETISRRGYRFLGVVENISSNEKITSSKAIEVINDNAPDNELVEHPASAQAKTKPFIIGIAVSLILVFSVISFASLFDRSPETIAAPISVNAAMNDGLDRIEHFGHSGAIEEAKTLFRDIIAKNPDHAASRAGLALSLIREYTSVETDPDILKDAKASAEKSLEIDEHLALSHIANAWVSEFEKDLDDAWQHLEQADILSPNNAFSAEAKIRILFKQRKFDEAEAVTRASISNHPENANFTIYLSQIQLYLNDIQGAIISGRNAIQLDPDSSRFYAHLAQLHHMNGATQDAIRTLQKGLEVQENPTLYNNLGTYLFFQGRYETAVSAFEKTVELEGNSHNALHWANLGDAYRWAPGREDDMENAYVRALQLWNESLLKSPNDSDLITRIALYSAKIGNDEEARSLLKTINFDKLLNSVEYYRSMVAYEILGNRESALSLLDKALNAKYPLTEIRNDPELKSFREDPNYHKLLAKRGI